MEMAPEVVTLHLWGVPGRALPAALGRMGLDRPLLRRCPATFWKLLGTGAGRTFTPRDLDARHWGLLASWARAADADAFEGSATARGWGRLADERLLVRMRPVTARGSWSRRTPFGEAAPARADGPVASITRARLRPRRAAAFWRAAAPVAADLRDVDGLRLAIGIGEAPLGRQGTFSLWSSTPAMTEFAHRRDAHQQVMARSVAESWYAEELFARFAVLDVTGTFAGRAP